MKQKTFKELQEIIKAARDLVSQAIKYEMNYGLFVKEIDKLFPEDIYFFKEGDVLKIKKSIFEGMQIDRVIPERLMSACDRYKNWPMARYLTDIMSESEEE